MGRAQHEGLENESSGDLLGHLSLGHAERQDAGMSGSQNLHDISYDYTFAAKNAAVTEKFILDLLSLSEVHSALGKGATEDSNIPMNCECSDFSVKTVLPKTWGPKSEEELQAVKEFIPHGTPDLEKLSDNDLNSKDEDILPMNVQEEQGTIKVEICNDDSNQDSSEQLEYTDHNLNGVRGAPLFKEIRTRRRREFHKIHTRRSRAKLNEKMDLLRRVLPEPPAGTVVKSKAQIIDYAITVLAKLPLNQLDTECPLAEKK